MKRSKMYLSVCCIFVLMIAFAILSSIDFNSQDASAQTPTPKQTASVEMKISQHSEMDLIYQKANRDSIESLKSIIEDDLKKNLDLRVIQSTNGHSEADWKIYCIFSVHYPVVGISVTLTHRDKLIMNTVAVVDLLDPESDYRVDIPTDQVKADMDKPIELALEILSQKLKDARNVVIIKDDSTIVVN